MSVLVRVCARTYMCAPVCACAHVRVYAFAYPPVRMCTCTLVCVRVVSAAQTLSDARKLESLNHVCGCGYVCGCVGSRRNKFEARDFLTVEKTQWNQFFTWRELRAAERIFNKVRNPQTLKYFLALFQPSHRFHNV